MVRFFRPFTGSSGGTQNAKKKYFWPIIYIGLVESTIKSILIQQQAGERDTFSCLAP